MPEQTYKHFCVIDNDGYYVDFIHADFVLGENDVFNQKINTYVLKKGEHLMDISPPSDSMLKPRWNGTVWEETATAEELDLFNLREVVASALSKYGPRTNLEIHESVNFGRE